MSVSKRDSVLAELIKSEQEHISDLSVCESVYLLPLKAKVSSQVLLHAVSSNLAMIRSFNVVLLDELKKQAALPFEKQLVGKVFVRLSDFSKMLVQYCGVQPQFLQQIEDERKIDKHLDAFLEEAKGKARGLNLGQFLLKPVQRICKYPLLLQELAKATPENHADHENLLDAIAKTNQVVVSLNDGQRALESFSKIAQIAAAIKTDVPELDMLQKGRSFVREGPFDELSNGKRRGRSLVLFNDVLLVGKYQKGKFVYRSHHPISQTECVNLPPGKLSASEAELGFQLVFKGDSPMSLIWPSKDVRFLWFNELQGLIAQSKSGRPTPVVTHVQAAAPSAAAAQKKRAAAEEKMKIWREMMQTRAANQLAELQREAAARKLYEERGITSSTSAALKSFRFPRFCLAVPDAIVDFSSLLQISKRFSKASLNARTEFVVIGEAGSGRSSLIDAMLGVKLLGGNATNRVVKIELKHNKAGPFWVVAGNERVATPEEARELISREMSKKDKSPILVRHESPLCVDVLIVDTPAIGVSDAADAMVRAECSVCTRRRLLFVESAKRWDGVVCYPFAVRSNLDPLFERSHFVYTKFALQLQLFCLPNDLPSYLNQCLLPQLCSFVTLPNPSKYDDTLEASEILQRNVLSQFRYDEQAWQGMFSASSLLARLNRLMMDVFVNDVFPTALARFDYETKACISNYKEQCLNAELNLNVEIRKWISAHIARASSTFVRLMVGSFGENPSVGVTAAAEVATSKAALWSVNELGVAPQSPHVLFSDCKLSGGARIQRVLDEFAVMVKQGTAAADAAMIAEQKKEKEAAEQVSSAIPVALPPFASIFSGVAFERRSVALSNIVFPCLQTLRSRVVALVHELILVANRSALDSVPLTKAEGMALNRCKLSLVVQSVIALAERQLTLFVDHAKDAVLLNMEAQAFQEHVASLLVELVVTPLTDTNMLLNTMHTSLALQGVESLYNRAQIENDFAARIQDAKRQVDNLKDTFGQFNEKLSKVLKA